MRQTAKVEAVLPRGQVQLSVLRQSACSGDCHKCSGCGAVEQRLLLTAHNSIGAKAGDRVVVESSTAVVLWAAVLVYLLPLVIFVALYIATMPLGRWGPVIACAGMCWGCVPALLYNRKIRKRPPVYTVVSYAE